MIKPVPVEQIAEVAQFMAAAERLESFKEKHARLFSELAEITADYNQKLEAADKASRQHKVSCGPFTMFQVQRSYDAKSLYDILGQEDFLAVGGTVSTQRVYDVDKPRLNAAVASGKLPKEVLDLVVKETPKYNVPTKISI